MSATETVKRTPLYDQHVAAGGKIVPFAGYELPVQYTGIIAETNVVRTGVGMFDVSHMARLWFRGERVAEFLEWVTANHIGGLVDGQGHYSLLPNAQGGLVDDIITYRVNDTTFRMVVNAANHSKDVAWLHTQNKFGVEIEDETEETAMIAVQGPKAAEVLAGISDIPDQLRSAGLFQLSSGTIGGVKCFAPCSGYTGEHGFELICAASDAGRLWDALLGAGVVPCGLGSRDTLRVEAGLPLYGHELGDDMSPIAAGLGWVIKKDIPYLGSEIIEKARAEGTPLKLQGIRLEAKRLTSPGMKVFVDGREVGEVSSGVVSPTLDCGIAFAFLDASLKLKTPCEVDIRGRREPAMVVSKRFLKG